MHVFQSQVGRLAGDSFAVELYPNGQLGDQRAMVQQISRGSLHFANIASGVLASLGVVDVEGASAARGSSGGVASVASPGAALSGPCSPEVMTGPLWGFAV